MPSFYFNYTSKSRLKCMNTSINDFFQNCLGIHFAPVVPRSYSVVSDGGSILSSRAIFASAEWISGWSSWLRVIYSTSLIFYSVRTDVNHPEHFRATSIVLPIFFISFLSPVTFDLYSRWSLTILVAPYSFFIQKFKNYFLFVWEHHITSY